jgi:hypothetical protein
MSPQAAVVVLVFMTTSIVHHLVQVAALVAAVDGTVKQVDLVFQVKAIMAETANTNTVVVEVVALALLVE